MKNLCIYCNISLPVIFRTYQFLEIGTQHEYLEEQKNHDITKEFLIDQVLPVLEISQQMMASTKQAFKIAFNITGPSLLLFNKYTSIILQVFKELSSNKNIEFLISPYSTPGLYKHNSNELISQLSLQQNILKKHLPKAPSHFMIKKKYTSTKMLREINELGIKPLLLHLPSKLSEVAKNNPKKYEPQLSSFGNGDRVTDKNSPKAKEEIPDFLIPELDAQLKNQKSREVVEFFYININYQQNKKNKGLVLEKLRDTFSFMKRFNSETNYLHPSECVNSSSWKVISGALFNVVEPVSSINEIQSETCQYLHYLSEKMKNVRDELLQRDWLLIRDTSHLFFMDSRFFNENFASQHINPFGSPYSAFINYTNVLEDFNYRLDKTL